MALNFPNSPTVGQTYTDVTSGFSYEWDGTVWKSYSPASSSNIKVLDDISGSFDGVTQTFALTSNSISITPASAQQLRIVLGGVVQSPGVDYTISTSNIVFTTAPSAALDFSGVSLGPAVPVTYANDGNIYIRNTYTGAGTTGPFAFSQGYTIGYLDVYRNGVRLSSGTDFVGTSGTNFFLSEIAEVNDEIEAIGYTITSIVVPNTNFSDINVSGPADFTNIHVTGVGTINTLDVNGPADFVNINSTGVITATSFVGSLTGTASTATAAGTAYGLTGSPNITVGTVTGNLTGTASTATAAGTAYGLTGSPIISVSRINVGTGASIHQPASNVLTLGTNNTEKLRITSTGGLSLNNGELVERVNITAGKLSDNTNINLENGMVHFFTTTETTTSTPNIRVSSSVSLDSVMEVGDTISVSIITTAAAAAYSANITIDGGAVTEKWPGGSAPTAGSASGNDLYTFQIIKTGSATFTVLANRSNFA